jgi:molecular chaperone GrpE
MKKMLGTAKGDEAAGEESEIAVGDIAEPATVGTGASEEALLNAGSEAQRLRVELAERDRVIATLKQDLERLRADEKGRVEEIVGAQVEKLMSAAAAPVAQLLTQTYLAEIEGKPVQAKDVLAVAKRIIRALEDDGLSLVGGVGESVSFDPNYHQPLSSRADLKPGDPAVVKVVGVSYAGRVLRKASVDKLEG